MHTLNIQSLVNLYKEKVADLHKFSSCREKAFTVDSDAAGKGLKNILAQKETWNDLCCWNTELQCDINWDEIYKAFCLVEDASISKTEFRTILQPTKERILAYEEKLKTEISEIKADIDQYYDNFVTKTEPYKFIFEDKAIKKIIIDNLLLGKK